MCGIFGYIGPRFDTAEILIEGLKRLEYRGYDSAGLALYDDERLWVRKTTGKIRDLEKKLEAEAVPRSRLGIAHTRWATHGAPNDQNAHPHLDESGSIAVVHNGIIENHAALRALLEKEGHEFESETDTEVLVHLIEKFRRANDLPAALRKALGMLHGTYGIIVIDRGDPDVLVAARHGSPLVLGIGENEYFVSSDVAPLVPHTRNVIYFDDNEMVVVRRDGYRTMTLDARPVNKAIAEVDWEIEEIEKGGFPHFMLKEIHEQPETIANAMRGRMLIAEGTSRLQGLNLNLDSLRKIDRVILTACGTSWHAALVGEYLIEDLARIPVEVEYASEFRYRNPILDESTVVFLISQSGETADTLAALREAKAKGALPLGIVNVVGSTIARESAGGVYIHAGPEIGVASTKAFTAQVTVLALIALLMGRQRDLSVAEGKKILRGLLELPGKVKRVLAKNDVIETIAAQYASVGNFLYLGRGINFPVALEGALKMKEISYIHAEGYPAAEMKHGPIALIDEDMPVVVIALRDSAYEKVLSNIQEVRARHGRVIAIATEGDTEISNHADHVIELPSIHPLLSPILAVVPLQLLAYHVAVKRGCDVDQPRNLAKSVTVE
ncbi:MAG: glutamine--fructose-6-phosphate transaminase (isomerizing) [Candidatus Hydrogenedentota bacterium]|nr:MAG: glutamine--fructose-6-phosphate transaminase (isomerizing) [Candidatus Hydrogenedentota bacterium]